MANPNPHQARQAKKAKRRRQRIRKVGTLEDALKEQWRAILCARDVLQTTQDEATVLRAVHAITQANQAFAKLIEVGELEADVAEIKRILETREEGGLRKVA